MRDARRLLEHIPALSGTGGDKIGYPALTDHRVAVTAETRIHKQLVNIAQPARLAVDEILALSRAVVAAGDGDLILVAAVEAAVGVVEPQGHLGVAQRLTLARAAENDVLHLGASEGLGRLLAQHPSHGVRNIALARAVGADDGGDTSAEHGLIGKGFESLHFKRF